jgi:hypothetical protein
MKMMSDNVIDLRKCKPLDPILRKGDLVRITEEDLTGIVIEVLQRFGEDADAPGQAAIFSVAVPRPDEDEWDLVEMQLEQVRRILGPEADALRGYEGAAGGV